ncbi:MAG: hypothetical protein KDD73_09300 [Anaerolineales bacterium]|nr:hypothetical protein [Anaerolineales bacterium]MCB9127487.1 hypothetical protein [Ardenticatenales bacterium]
MEEIIRDQMLEQEITVLTASGGKFSGTVQSVHNGVLTLTYKEKTSYIAVERIEAVWATSDEDGRSVSIGFGGR